jgi:hypothetical protein
VISGFYEKCFADQRRAACYLRGLGCRGGRAGIDGLVLHGLDDDGITDLGKVLQLVRERAALDDWPSLRPNVMLLRRQLISSRAARAGECRWMG